MNSPAPSLSDLLHHIASGAYDGEASAKAIVGAINARVRAVSAAAGAAVAASLVPGDRVRITGDVRPKSFQGQEGVVTAIPSRGKVSVRLDGGIVDTRVPPSILTKIAAAVEETAAEATERLVKAFEAEHAQYPQYAGHTDGAIAVPLRGNWKHRGENLAKGTFVLLMTSQEKWEHDGVSYLSIWHPHLLACTSIPSTDLAIPKGAR